MNSKEEALYQKLVQLRIDYEYELSLQLYNRDPKLVKKLYEVNKRIEELESKEFSPTTNTAVPEDNDISVYGARLFH